MAARRSWSEQAPMKITRTGWLHTMAPPYPAGLSALLVVSLFLLPAIGCGGGSSGTAGPTASNSRPKSGSFFSPVSPTLSPDTVWHNVVNGVRGEEVADAVPVAPSSASFDHYFYIVNGLLSDGSPLPTGPGTSSLSSTPLVLTVSGRPPFGATNPNGGTQVSLAPYNPTANGSQLWKAVEAPTAANFYLRSAESFAVSQVNSGAPSMLVGLGTAALPLELGFLSTWGSAIYSNQQNSPAGDNSGFEQWSYDTNTAQLTNLDVSGQLYNTLSGGTIGVAPQAPSPGNQWYTYPSYFVGQVVSEPNSSPPFPAPATDGQTAAYDYISNYPGVNVGSVSCNYEGTTYAGIRCEYEILTTSSALTNCYSAIASANNNPPTSYNGTPISSSDWSAVASQIANECTYAVGVQNTFNFYNQIFVYVFVNAGDQILALSKDVGVSSGQSMTAAAPIELVDGVIYTLLNATTAGGTALFTGGGAFANLMETAVNSALSVPGNTLNQKLATTVGELYGALSTQFKQVSDGAVTAETAILQDWGRLQQIGPATNIVGYNGLGLAKNGIINLESQALSAYELSIMQQLMPLAYDQFNSFANKGSITGLNTSNYNSYSYATFGGASTDNYNLASFVKSGGSSIPSLKVLQTDIFDNGANPFEVFNAINGWSLLKVDVNGSGNQYCTVATITLFNATAGDLNVNITPSEGTIAMPGCSGVSCESSWTGAELRPYGYLTLYAGANGGAHHLQDKVDIYSGSTLAGSLSVGGTSFCSNGASLSGTATPSAGFSFSAVGVVEPRHSGDGGVWTTIYQ